MTPPLRSGLIVWLLLAALTAGLYLGGAPALLCMVAAWTGGVHSYELYQRWERHRGR